MTHTTLIFLFNDEDQVLLGYKSRGFGEGWWNGFGGKFDPNKEEPINAALRELKEETGIVLTSSVLNNTGLVNFIRPDKKRPCHVFTGCYNGKFSDSEEMHHLQRFDKKEIPYDTMWEADTILLPKLLNRQTFTSMNIYYDEEHKLIRCE